LCQIDIYTVSYIKHKDTNLAWIYQ